MCAGGRISGKSRRLSYGCNTPSIRLVTIKTNELADGACVVELTSRVGTNAGATRTTWRPRLSQVRRRSAISDIDEANFRPTNGGDGNRPTSPTVLNRNKRNPIGIKTNFAFGLADASPLELCELVLHEVPHGNMHATAGKCPAISSRPTPRRDACRQIAKSTFARLTRPQSSIISPNRTKRSSRP